MLSIRKIGKMLKLFLAMAALIVMIPTIAVIFIITIATVYLTALGVLTKGVLALVYFLYLIALGFALVFNIRGKFLKISFVWSNMHLFYFAMLFIISWLAPNSGEVPYIEWREVQHLGPLAMVYYPTVNLLYFMANLLTQLFFSIRPLILYSTSALAIFFGMISGLVVYFSNQHQQSFEQNNARI